MIRVDVLENCTFGYAIDESNDIHGLEYVETFHHTHVRIANDYNNDEEYFVQKVDIPNLIKALQAAQKHIEENE